MDFTFVALYSSFRSRFNFVPSQPCRDLCLGSVPPACRFLSKRPISRINPDVAGELGPEVEDRITCDPCFVAL